ncbi:hypothetical protein SKAU_G00130660 [Synaphobranchus kaupii]|uniref:Uncharacterized protein n=1 Tax=Synaphobranchus kaupii TaxID=118154 RepID=A0A9Q1J3E7_SYNKA|nr:hypothetical protein SKAU_G00130660 [Synaphobranchus kaupii]
MTERFQEKWALMWGRDYMPSTQSLGHPDLHPQPTTFPPPLLPPVPEAAPQSRLLRESQAVNCPSAPPTSYHAVPTKTQRRHGNCNYPLHKDRNLRTKHDPRAVRGITSAVWMTVDAAEPRRCELRRAAFGGPEEALRGRVPQERPEAVALAADRWHEPRCHRGLKSNRRATPLGPLGNAGPLARRNAAGRPVQLARGQGNSERLLSPRKPQSLRRWNGHPGKHIRAFHHARPKQQIYSRELAHALRRDGEEKTQFTKLSCSSAAAVYITETCVALGPV